MDKFSLKCTRACTTAVGKRQTSFNEVIFKCFHNPELYRMRHFDVFHLFFSGNFCVRASSFNANLQDDDASVYNCENNDWWRATNFCIEFVGLCLQLGAPPLKRVLEQFVAPPDPLC